MKFFFKSFVMLLFVALLFSACDCDDDDSSDDDAAMPDDTTDDTIGDDSAIDDTYDDDMADDTGNIDESCVFTVSDSDGVDNLSPVIAMRPSGGFVIFWEQYAIIDEEKAASEEGVMARFYGADGLPYGDPVRVFGTWNPFSARLRIAASDDAVLLMWTFPGNSEYPQGVYLRWYHWDGTPYAEAFELNEDSDNRQDFAGVAMNASGNIAIQYLEQDDEGDWTYWVRLLESQDDPHADDVSIDVLGFSDMAADGGFVIGWANSDTENFPEYDSFVNIYDAAGALKTGPIQVHAYTTNRQVLAGLSVAPDGQFVVAWHSYGQDSADWDVYARLFNADGSVRTDEWLVNETLENDQYCPSIAMMSNGRFLVSWLEETTENCVYGMRGRHYDADGNPRTGEFTIFNHSSLYPDFVDSKSVMNEEGVFVVVAVRYNDVTDYYDVIAHRFGADNTPLCPGETQD